MRSKVKQHPKLPFDENLPAEQKDWKKVHFEQIAECINDKVDDPSKAGVDRYVGLEHLDPESLKISRWGTPDDVEASKLRFKPGDIIFGKRRAYQRKLAVADFEGICSAHAMVLRAREEEVLKDFLPYFLQTDTFFERALSISIGSLSPTINWTTLAKQEFLIPSKDDQRRIADILWAADEAINKLENVHQEELSFHFVLMETLFSKGISNQTRDFKTSQFGQIPKEWKVEPISQIADIAYGISESVASNNDPSLGWPILTSANISLSGDLDISKLNYIEEPKKEAFILKKGDILFNWRSGSPEHVGKTAIFDFEGSFTFASFVLRVRVNECMNNIFLHKFLSFMRMKKLFGSETSQQVNFKMNASIFRNICVIIPSIQEQLDIIRVFQEQEKLYKTTINHILSIKQIKYNLMKRLLMQVES